jgi:hypothetical protein
MAQTRCGNCQCTADEEDIIALCEVPDLGERLDPGGVVPTGECRRCGALAYLTA